MKAIVIVANGWNASWLGCYGNEWLQTPHLDRLAGESVLFDQHFAINPSPAEWRHSLMSGRFELGSKPARPEHNLIQTLRQASVWTSCISDFDNADAYAWDERTVVTREADSPPGAAMTAAITQQLDALKDRDHWLLWIETDRLVSPWSVSLDYFDKYVDEITPEVGEPRHSLGMSLP